MNDNEADWRLCLRQERPDLVSAKYRRSPFTSVGKSEVRLFSLKQTPTRFILGWNIDNSAIGTIEPSWVVIGYSAINHQIQGGIMEGYQAYSEAGRSPLAGSAVRSQAAASQKTPIVLIHGAWYDSSCWHKVESLLRADGHTVLSPDLPGYGTNSEPDPETDLDAYVDAVVSAVTSVPAPVALVGHSIGGIFISQAAERVPERIASLTYVCAFMLQDGQSRLAVAEQDPGSIALKYRIPAGDGLVTFTPDGFVECFCQDCDADDVSFILDRRRPQPIRPMRTALRLTEANYGRVPRHYVRCTLDRGITLGFQDKMIAASPVERIFDIDAGHSPFMSKPEELVKVLEEVAKVS